MPLWRADPSSRGVIRSVYVQMCVIRRNNNLGQLQWVSRRSQANRSCEKTANSSLLLFMSWTARRLLFCHRHHYTTVQLVQWKTRPCWQKCGVILVFVAAVRSLWGWLRSVLPVWLNWSVSECPHLSQCMISTTRLNVFGLRNPHLFDNRKC